MKIGSPEEILDGLKPGQRVYIQGGPGECSTFIDLLKANPGAAAGVELWSCLIPGINTFDYGSLPNGPDLVTFMASPALAPSMATGRTRIDAMPYSEMAAKFASLEFDVAIFHTALPDRNGSCSFGISCEAAGLVWPRSRRRIAFLNQRMPSIPQSDAMPADRIDLAIEIDAPLAAESSRHRSEEAERIGRHAAALIPDGAVIQSGIGEAPGAVVAALHSHKRLGVHSGLITGDCRRLAETGALDPAQEHVTGVAWGGAEFYAWLGEGAFMFLSAAETHGHDRLASISNFVSIGSALEVDLEGAINLEWLDDRRVSSVGGAPDFMRGAAASRGGRSIIGLPSISRTGRSRIVPRLTRPSIPSSLADTVVTEYGAAQIRGLAHEARAEALIAIAAPEHRDALAASRHG